MSRQYPAFFLCRRALAGTAHVLALCCIPIFTLVLVMNNSAPSPPEHHNQFPPGHQ
jgi:hypothetical protein